MLSLDDSRPAPATRLAVPKWPFMVADATLLAVALGVWMTGGAAGALPQLFCLGAVALGAVIMVTPFALEAFPPGSWRMLAGGGAGGGAVSGSEGEWRRQAQAAAEAVEHAARANAALENSARRFDARFAPLVEVHQGLAAAVAELREATAARAAAVAGEAQATTREFERLRKDQAEKFKTTEAKITPLEDTLGLIAAHIRTRSTPPVPASAGPAPAPAPARVREVVARVEEPAPAPVEERVLVAADGSAMESSEPAYLGSVTAFAPAPVEAPPPAEEPAAEKIPEEQSMMSRAMSRAQSSSETPAVAGIIMARVRRPRKSPAPAPVVAAAASVEVETPVVEEMPPPAVETSPIAAETPAVAVVTPAEVAASAVLETPMAPAPEAATVEVAGEPADGETTSALRRSARAKALALRGAEDEEAKKNTPVVFPPAPAVEAAVESGPTQGELLAREADTIRRKRASRSPLSVSTLTANVLIGIGNKPFVRGTGPGLSLDKGVPMEFVEIGQWRWVAPSVGKEPVTIRIFKNDEIAAAGEDIVLRSGQTIEVSPVFPA
jgi:hypothetical protein